MKGSNLGSWVTVKEIIGEKIKKLQDQEVRLLLKRFKFGKEESMSRITKASVDERDSLIDYYNRG